MAFEADRVVVELIAQNEQFDAATKESAANFSEGMATIKTTGSQAEGAVGQFSSALKENRLQMNQSRVGMLEFQHIARGVSDQFASGGLSTQLFTTHIGELSEAIVLSGGAFGKLGAFLQGPWGIALTLATTAVATLISTHLKHKETLDDVYDKLVKHKEQTALNAQAEDIWSHSIEGLIERSDKLNDTLEKRLQTQTDLQREQLRTAQTDFAAATAAAAKLDATPGTTKEQSDAAEKAISRTAIALHSAQVLAGQDAGAAMASITLSAKTAIDQFQHALEIIQTAHPELAEQGPAAELSASFNHLKEAINEAAASDVSFDKVVTAANTLNDELLHGTIKVDAYDKSIRNLAQSLIDAANAAKNAPKAIQDFKNAVIGAEGTGKNGLGSSAAGFGQFMPSTFESYFKQLFPQQAAGLSNAQIDQFRNNETVAKAVIDAATKDYVKVLQAAGQQISEASLYTVHLLGAGDAKKLFAASPDTPTSSFLSPGVLRGNPFLKGTASDARSAIAQRIGDSDSAVSSGAVAAAQAIAKAEEDAAKAAEKRHDALLDLESKEEKVTIEVEKQSAGYKEGAQDIALQKQAEEHLREEMKKSAELLQETKNIGSQLVDDVLNPDNWDNWGDAAKRVLHDVMSELYTLALINPIKNGLFGSNLPTLGSIANLFGGGGFNAQEFSDLTTVFGVPGIPGRASGGPVSSGSPYVVGESGPELFIPSSSGTIVPNNASAASPFGGGGRGMVIIGVQASDYFDAKVLDVAGPVIASASTSAAQGGAALARNRLSRQAMHQL